MIKSLSPILLFINYLLLVLLGIGFLLNLHLSETVFYPIAFVILVTGITAYGYSYKMILVKLIPLIVLCIILWIMTVSPSCTAECWTGVFALGTTIVTAMFALLLLATTCGIRYFKKF